MKSLKLITLLFMSASLQAQNADKREFGEISKNEIGMTHCDFDSSATAVVLFDVGESRFMRTKDGFGIKFTRHKRIKILHESGRNHAIIDIPFFINDDGRKEKLKNIEAFTYNMDNGELKKQPLDPSTIYEEQISQKWHQKKFVFPNVQKGSILEYKYDLITPFIFNLNDWEFQSRIPTIYSEYKVFMIPFYAYVNVLQGIDSLDVKSSVEGKKKFEDFGIEYRYYIHTFAERNIEAFRDESYITSRDDFIKKIDFQLATIYYPDGRTEDRLTTWKSLRDELLDHFDFGKYLKKSRSHAKRLINEKIDIKALTNEEKIKTIVEYVKNNFTWNGFYTKYSSKSPKDFITSKNGNAADINLFLIALLNEGGIAAEPMILSTRNHGKIKLYYPFHHTTNYVVAYVKSDRNFITDATQNTLDYDLVPTYCINDYGLLVNKEKEDKWMSIKYSASSDQEIKISISIDAPDLMANLDFSSSSTFFRAYEQRKAFGSNIEKIRESYSGKFDEINAVSIKDYSNTSLPYSFTFEAKRELEQLGAYIAISPFMDLPIAKNKLIMEERSYPVDFIFPYRNSYEVHVHIPDGYKITKIPDDTRIDNACILLQSKYIYDANLNKVSIEAFYEFKEAVYQPDQYKELRESINHIVKTMNKKIYLAQE